MSYGIYVNDKQCLGNGECPKVLIKALNKQGAKIYKSKDYCFHDFEIKELQPIIEALEQYIFDIDIPILRNINIPRSFLYVQNKSISCIVYCIIS